MSERRFKVGDVVKKVRDSTLGVNFIGHYIGKVIGYDKNTNILKVEITNPCAGLIYKYQGAIGMDAEHLYELVQPRLLRSLPDWF